MEDNNKLTLSVLLVRKGLMLASDLQEASLLRRNPSSGLVLGTRIVIRDKTGSLREVIL
jgi:hypothetical protein